MEDKQQGEGTPPLKLPGGLQCHGSADPLKLSEAEYLDKFGVNAYVREAILLVLENRPVDPIAFLENYFRTRSKPCAQANRAMDLLSRCHPAAPAFQDNIYQAYGILRSLNGSVTAPSLMEGLFQVASKVQQDAVLRVVKSVAPNGSLTREQTLHVVKVVHALQEFLLAAAWIFNESSKSQPGFVDKQVALALLQRICDGVTFDESAVASLPSKPGQIPGREIVSQEAFDEALLRGFILSSSGQNKQDITNK